MLFLYKNLRNIVLFFIFLTYFQIIFAQNYQSANCYTIAVGRNVSATKSVLIAHNEDDYGDFVVNLYKVPPQTTVDTFFVPSGGYTIPQTHTYSYVWFETTTQKFGDFFVNEFGVTICSNQCQSREDTAKGTIDYNLRLMVVKYASSAKQAVLIAANLVEKYGYNSSGRTYCFADARDIWIMAIVQGRHWIAQRVSPDKVAIVPNYYTIGEINLDDSENFMASPDIVDYAVKRGWYNPKSGKSFNFRLAYGSTSSLYAIWNIPRHLSGINRLSAKKYNYGENLPFEFSPTKKTEIADLEDVLSNHYEGTDFQTCYDLHTNPHKSVVHRICNYGTKFSVIVELHNTYPENNINVIWFAPFNPCVNPYIPIACAIDSFPSVYHLRPWQEAAKNHFNAKTNSFSADPMCAFSIFHKRNNIVNADYQKKSPDEKKLKANFQTNAKKIFRQTPTGATSFKLLNDYYKLVLSQVH